MMTANISNQTMTIPITLFIGSKEIELDALIDSGATGCYIHQAFANSHKIPSVPIAFPIEVKNVDGTLNKSGHITHKSNIDILVDGLHMEQEVHVTNLGKHRLILGLPWLRTWNPEVDWEKGTLQWRNNREVNAYSLINYMEEQDSNLALRIVNSIDHEQEHLDNLEQNGLVQVKLLSSHAKLPIRATTGSAGYDLISPEAISIPSHSRKLIDTKIALALPNGTYGRIAPRSGLSMKAIDIGAGVIDSDYRGSVKALLINNGNIPFQVAKGDRMAQSIIEKISTGNLVQKTELLDTERSKKGFGSTGSPNEENETLHFPTTTLPIEENATLQNSEGNGTTVTLYFDIYRIYHEVDELPHEIEHFINTKISHSQALVKKHEGQIEDLPKKSIEELVPQELHEYLIVFSEEAAARFPESKPWDHKILLKPDFKPKKGKIYDLSPEEDIQLQEFLEENLAKGYIEESDSPMASSFFFVEKKGTKKKRPCQDY